MKTTSPLGKLQPESQSGEADDIPDMQPSNATKLAISQHSQESQDQTQRAILNAARADGK